MGDAAIRVTANLDTKTVDIQVMEMVGDEVCLDMSIDPDLARELALNLSSAAISVEVSG